MIATRQALAVLALVLTVGVATACEPVVPPPLAAAPAPDASLVASAIDLVDGFRAAIGAPGLTVDPALAATAQHWADALARGGVLQHSGTVGVGMSWSVSGENVGVGASVDVIESAFEASAPHRANLSRGDYDRIGVGVAASPDGRVWVVQQFLG